MEESFDDLVDERYRYFKTYFSNPNTDKELFEEAIKRHEDRINELRESMLREKAQVYGIKRALKEWNVYIKKKRSKKNG